MLMFALQKEVERGTTIVKSLFDYCFNSNEHTHMFMFVTQAFCFFIVQFMFFLVCNLGLFEITELEHCM